MARGDRKGGDNRVDITLGVDSSELGPGIDKANAEIERKIKDGAQRASRAARIDVDVDTGVTSSPQKKGWETRRRKAADAARAEAAAAEEAERENARYQAQLDRLHAARLKQQQDAEARRAREAEAAAAEDVRQEEIRQKRLENLEKAKAQAQQNARQRKFDQHEASLYGVSVEELNKAREKAAKDEERQRIKQTADALRGKGSFPAGTGPAGNGDQQKQQAAHAAELSKLENIGFEREQERLKQVASHSERLGQLSDEAFKVEMAAEQLARVGGAGRGDAVWKQYQDESVRRSQELARKNAAAAQAAADAAAQQTGQPIGDQRQGFFSGLQGLGFRGGAKELLERARDRIYARFPVQDDSGDPIDLFGEEKRRTRREQRAREAKEAEEAAQRAEDARRAKFGKAGEDDSIRVSTGRRGRGKIIDADASIKELDQMRDKLIAVQVQLNRIAKNNAGTQLGQDARHAADGINDTLKEARDLRIELGQPTGSRRRLAEIRADMLGIGRQAADAKEAVRSLKSEAGGGGPGGGGPGGPGGGGGRSRLPGLFGIGGGSGGVGTIATSILTRDIIRGTIRDFERLISVSVQSAHEQEQAYNNLYNASTLAGRGAEINIQAADRLANTLKLTHTLAAQIEAEAQRAASAAGRGSQTDKLARTVADLAASRGLKQDETPKLIDQLRNEQSKFAEENLNKRPEQIFIEYAARNRARLTEELKASGLDSYEISLKRLAQTLSTFEQKQAIFDELMNQSGKNSGEAARRLHGVSGELESAAARWGDLSAAIGNFLLRNKTIIQLLERAGAVVERFAGGAGGPEGVRGTGPGGQITAEDIAKFSKGYAAAGNQQTSRTAQATATTLGGLLFLPNIIAGAIAQEGADDPKVTGGQAVTRGLSRIWTNYAKLFGQATEEDAQEGQRIAEEARRRQLEDMRKTGRIVFTDAKGRDIKSDAAEVAGLAFNQYGRLFGKGAENYKVKGFVSQDDADKAREAADTAENARQKQVAADDERERRLISFQRQLHETFGNVAQQYASDNPLVKLFTDAGTALERAREKYQDLSAQTQFYFAELERQNLRVQISTTKMDLYTKAIQSQTEAIMIRFRAANQTITPGEERRLPIVQTATAAATNIPSLYAQRRFLAQGVQTPFYDSHGPQSIVGEQLSNLDRLYRAIPLNDREASRNMRDIVNGATLQIIQQLPPALVRNDPRLRGQAIRAYDDTIANMNQSVTDAIKKAEVGDRAANIARDAARQQVSIVQQLAQGSGITNRPQLEQLQNEVNQRIIAITGQLDERELSPDLREARIKAFEADAQYRLRSEERAKEAERLAQVTRIGIYHEIHALRVEMQNRALGKPETEIKPPELAQAGVEVKITNDTEARVNTGTLPAQPTGYPVGPPKSEVNRYAQDLFNTRPGYSTANNPQPSGR